MVVAVAEIVTILDSRSLRGSADNADLVARARKAGRLFGESLETCNGLVITVDAVFGSPFTPPVLARRIREFRVL